MSTPTAIHEPGSGLGDAPRCTPDPLSARSDAGSRWQGNNFYTGRVGSLSPIRPKHRCARGSHLNRCARLGAGPVWVLAEVKSPVSTHTIQLLPHRQAGGEVVRY